ncbi:MAG: hypothetical protein PF637_12580 [Spirochaetes bacterium]|jgi:hypothetical protein|nr:hypothetical protein [Spirochaetota bacterium]
MYLFTGGLHQFRILSLAMIIFLFPAAGMASPLIVSTGLHSDSARSSLLVSLFETHFTNLVRIGGDFDPVKPESLMPQLRDNNLLEDSALMRFARTSGIDIVVRGSVLDRGDSVIVDLYALSYDVPFNGNVVARYTVTISFKNVEYSARELSYCMEEHTGRFLAELYSEYSFPVRVKIRNGVLEYDDFPLKEKRYDLYHIKDESRATVRFSRESSLAVKNRTLVPDGFVQDGNYFVLRTFKDEAAFLEEFYYGRKKEIVFRPVTLEETLFTALATPLIGILSPIAAPATYYSSSDYEGLGLWALNNAPYMYIGIQGLLNRPTVLREDKKNISKFQKSSFYFGLYYFLGAGASMYADSAGARAAQSAAAYNTVDPYMGSDYSALYFSILGSGGGHFYKGYRGWGYLFFHLDNTLLFTSLYYLLDEERYDGSSYSRSSSDKTYGYIAAGAALLVRAFEVYHCSTLKFNIQNGTLSDSSVSLVPIVSTDPNGSLIAGFGFERKL